MVPHEQTVAAASSAAAGITAIALVPLTTGRPVVDLVMYALAGGLAAVWLDERDAVTISFRWALSALAKMLVAALVGIAGSEILLSAVPAFPSAVWLANIPQKTVAFILALLAHKGLRGGLPWVAGEIKARFGKSQASKESSNAGGA